MKKLFSNLPKRLLAVVTTLALVAGTVSTAFAAFGPTRDTKAWSPDVRGFDYVTFNSFTGVPGVGDERAFFSGVQVGVDAQWTDPVNNVKQDAVVKGKIYIHNGADATLNDQPDEPGVAKDVKVRVALPTGAKQGHQATAFISASNANPTEVFDTLDITGQNNGFFELDYVEGSARLNFNNQATPIGDELVTTGVNLGEIPGCFPDVREVTFDVKVKMPHYKIQKEVRFAGQTSNDWKKSVNSKPGDNLEWLITFENVGLTELKQVKIVDEIPVGVSVDREFGVRLINAGYAAPGYRYPDADNPIQMEGRQININIGDYKPAGQVGNIAYIMFRTKVDAPPANACGQFALKNKAFSTPEGFGAIFETADVIVDKVCQPDQPRQVKPAVLVKTGPGAVAGVFFGTSAIGAVLHRLFTKRFLG